MSRTTRLAASATVILVVLIVLAACGGADPGASPTAPPPSPTASPDVNPTTPASPTPAPAETPAPTASPDETQPPTAAISVDSVVRTTVAGLRIREAPSTGATSLGTLAPGAQSFVVDRPVSADGHSWYLLSGLGLPQASGCATVETDPWECPAWFGWAAAGTDDAPWLEPTGVDCPAWPTQRMNDELYAVQRFVYLACYGDEQRSIVGYFPEIPDDAGLGGACAEVPEEHAWIGCNLRYVQIVADEELDMFHGLILAVDERSVAMPARGQWIRVTGRYDHPAAQDCTWGSRPEQTMLYCRAEFVVESATAVAAP